MIKQKKTDPKKALKFESKGDKLVGKKKFREALKEYEKSESLNPERVEIYDKLISTHSLFEHEWREEDFSNSMSWTMRRQELQNPQIRLVHQTFSVEYREIQKLLQVLMTAADPDTENRLIERILGFGEQANLPMLHLILQVKALATEQLETPPSEPL